MRKYSYYQSFIMKRRQRSRAILLRLLRQKNIMRQKTTRLPEKVIISNNIIPRNIFQTHKSMTYIKSKPDIFNALKSWAIYSNSFNYYFYNDKMCDNFIKDTAIYINKDIYNAYRRLPMAVMKADLWRYCIIYHYGGIYADTDTICKTHPAIFINNSLLTIGPENQDHLCQWTFAAPKGSPILKSIIDVSVERILNLPEIKGEHIIHYLTGPGVFTYGIEKYLKHCNLPTFEHDRTLYYNYPRKDVLTVFNYDGFHSKIVHHLFSGQHDDGWCKERDLKLK